MLDILLKVSQHLQSAQSTQDQACLLHGLPMGYQPEMHHDAEGTETCELHKCSIPTDPLWLTAFHRSNFWLQRTWMVRVAAAPAHSWHQTLPSGHPQGPRLESCLARLGAWEAGA